MPLATLTGIKYENSLPQILDGMFNYLEPSHIYVVGPAAYVKFVRETVAFQSSPNRFEISQGRANSPECRQAVVEFAKDVF